MPIDLDRERRPAVEGAMVTHAGNTHRPSATEQERERRRLRRELLRRILDRETRRRRSRGVGR